jgi:hypothetical protein
MLKYVGPYAIIAVSLFSLVGHNILELHLPPKDPDTRNAERSPIESLRDFGIRLGQQAGVAPLWLMYSPVPKHMYMVTLYVRAEGGEWVLADVPEGSGSLDYRSRRSVASALLWDFKRARIYGNYFVDHKDSRWLKRYVNFQRRRLEDRLGQGPLDVRIVAKVAVIPAPSRKGDWTPYNAEFRVYYDDVIER